MKFRIDFKDPDALNIHQIANDCLFADKDEAWEEGFANLSSVQRKEILDEVKESIKEFLDQWMRYSEYITVEFNMDTKTAMVVPLISQ
jgi:hypothetical protein